MESTFDKSSYLRLMVNNILNDRCVLMLGPGISETANGRNLQEAIQQYFEQETDLQLTYDIDHLVSFDNNKTYKTFYHSDLLTFYERHRAPSTLQKQIAQIPFHLMISTNPDLRQKYAFYQHEVDFHFYNKIENPTDVRVPSKERPLLYNLFGSIEEENSLIITSDDLFEFLFSILGGENRLPRELQNTLRQAKVFLFLGFNFEKWYLKLILRLFRLHQDPLPIVSKQPLEQGMRAFYINNFEMQFVDMDAKSLIGALHAEFEKRGKLRAIVEEYDISTHTQKEHPILLRIRELVKDGNLEEALENLEEFVEKLEDGELLDDVTILFGNYRRTQKKIRRQELSSENERIQIAQIQNGILDIVGELKDSLTSSAF